MNQNQTPAERHMNNQCREVVGEHCHCALEHGMLEGTRRECRACGESALVEYASGVEDVEVGSPDSDEADYGQVEITIDSARSGRMVQVLIPGGGLAQMGAAQLREFIAAAQDALGILEDDNRWR